MEWVELVLILLAVAAALEPVASRLQVPHAVLLVLGGLLVACAPGLPKAHFRSDVIFLLFVPPVLYWTALTAPFREFRRQVVPIALLAVGLVLLTAFAMGAFARTLFGLSWHEAIALGAIVAPTDAVAASRIARENGLPRSALAILEGESLANDATALVLFRFALGTAAAIPIPGVHLPAFLEVALSFLFAGCGGVATGLAIGYAVSWVRRLVRTRPTVENTISLLTPFAAYLPAEALHVSGVLAVVTAGLFLSRLGPRLVSAPTRLQAEGMWSVVAFILESLSFILIGLELPHAREALGAHPLDNLFVGTLVLTSVVIVVRLGWVFSTAFLVHPLLARGRLLADRLPDWRLVGLVGWSGTRGGVSLIIALSLPETLGDGTPLQTRSLLLFVTYGVILGTLVLQGLSLRPIMRRLNRQAADPGHPAEPLGDAEEEVREERTAREAMLRAGLGALERYAGKRKVDSAVVTSLRERTERRLRAVGEQFSREAREAQGNGNPSFSPTYRTVRARMLAAEREAVLRLRDEGQIDDEILLRIQRELDLEETLLFY